MKYIPLLLIFFLLLFSCEQFNDLVNEKGKISFHPNGEEALGEMPQVSVDVGSIYELPQCTFTLEGRHFIGWAYLVGEGEFQRIEESSIIIHSPNIQLYAQWEWDTLELIYQKNHENAQGTMATESYSYGDTVSLDHCDFSLTGYDFLYWSTDRIITPESPILHGGDPFLIKGNTTLYAHWSQSTTEPNSVTLHFDKNHPSAMGSMDYLTALNAPLTLPECGYSLDGFEFLYWTKDKNPAPGSVTYRANDFIHISEDTTLYAQWREVITHPNTVTLRYHRIDPTNVDIIVEEIHNYGSEIILKEHGFTGEGFQFLYWTNGPLDFSSREFQPGDRYTLTEDTNFYAFWDVVPIPQEIVFHGNNILATGSMNSIEFPGNVTIPVTIPSCNFSLEGYQFLYWSPQAVNPVDTYSPGETIDFSQGTTLYAHWQKQQTIDFLANNPSGTELTGAMGNLIVPANDSSPLPACGFHVQGWNFLGWSQSPTGPVEYANQQDILVEQTDITLYGVWQYNGTEILYQDGVGGEYRQYIPLNERALIMDCLFPCPDPAQKMYAHWKRLNSTSKFYSGVTTHVSSQVEQIILRVHWGEIRTITYHANDSAASGYMATQRVAQESIVSLAPVNFSKPGWTFLGWSYTPNGVVRDLDGARFTFGLNSDRDLYAQWAPPAVYSLGDRGPAGGWIIYDNGTVHPDGWRYIELAQRSVTPPQGRTGYIWGVDSDGVVQGLGAQIGDERQNHALLSSALGSGSTSPYAYEACQNYRFEYRGVVYDDWYLPSSRTGYAAVSLDRNEPSVSIFSSSNYRFWASDQPETNSTNKALSWGPNYDPRNWITPLGYQTEQSIRAVRFF